jgi:hypothetical protein
MLDPRDARRATTRSDLAREGEFTGAHPGEDAAVADPDQAEKLWLVDQADRGALGCQLGGIPYSDWLRRGGLRVRNLRALSPACFYHVRYSLPREPNGETKTAPSGALRSKRDRPQPISC